jgi:drug/metabolite transporter (DMT)-like permease
MYNKSYWRYVFITALGVFVLSPDSFFVRSMSASSNTVLFWRGLLLFLTVGLLCLCRYGQKTPAAFWAMGKTGLLSAFIFTVSSTSFVHSIKAVSYAGNTLVIMGAAPAFALIFDFLFFGKKPNPQTIGVIISILIALSVLFFRDQQSHLAQMGNIYALVVSICIAANIVLTRSSTSDSATFLALAGLLLVLSTLIHGTPPLPQSDDWLKMLMMGSLSVPLGFVMVMKGASKLNPGETGMIFLLETLFGPLWVWLLLGQAPGYTTSIAGIIIILSLLFHFRFAISDK